MPPQKTTLADTLLNIALIGAATYTASSSYTWLSKKRAEAASTSEYMLYTVGGIVGLGMVVHAMWRVADPTTHKVIAKGIEAI